MADQAGLEGASEQHGVIDTTQAGLTPQEVKTGELARRYIIEKLGNRYVLSIDHLAEMKDLRPRLETPQGIRLPGDSRGSKNRVWFFSIDGTYRGSRLTGCIFAGQCIMVQATSFESALNLAKEGLQSTLELAREFFEEQTRVIVSPLDNRFMNVDAGGRRAGAQLHAPDLATDPKLKAMLAERLGGKPWRGW